MNLIDILSSLQSCTIVAVDQDRGFVVTWNGSATLRMFTVGETEMEECDIRTFGEVPATLKEARQGAREWLAEMDEEEDAA